MTTMTRRARRPRRPPRRPHRHRCADTAHPQRCRPPGRHRPARRRRRQPGAAPLCVIIRRPLTGVSPIEASSGRQQHHRLNRGGDRQGNWALHVIIISRLRWHQPTKAPTWPNVEPKDAATKPSSAASSATSPAPSTAPSPPTSAPRHPSNNPSRSPLDIQRSFGTAGWRWRVGWTSHDKEGQR